MGSWSIGGNLLGNAQGLLGTEDNSPLVIETNGNPRLLVDTSGNVGIGSTSPSAKLYINNLDNSVGAVLATNAEGPGELRVHSYTTQPVDVPSFGIVHAFYNDEGNGFIKFCRGASTNGGFLTFGTSGSERLRVDTSGNLGVGTSAPTSQLHVNVAGSQTPISAMTIDVQTFGNEPNAQASHFLLVHDIGAAPPSGATHFAIRGDGYIGIGTPQPSARLSIVLPGTSEIQGNAKSNTFLTSSGGLGIAAASEVALASFGLTVANNLSLGIRAVRTAAGGDWNSVALGLGMDVDDTVRAGSSLWLHANGNVGVGTSTPSFKLHVNGGATATSLYISGGGQFDGNVGIALTENDVERGGEPASPLVVHGEIRSITDTTSVTIANGNVSVSGDVLLTGADCAEQFDVSEGTVRDPGTILVIDQKGALRESRDAYDKKVAGVVSGAGDYKHGIVLDQRPESKGRVAVALVGKVYCKVDAQYSPVEVGDLLTTSETPGHAMKATEAAKAFGSVIGKALRPLAGGKGLIPILIALQ